MKKYLANIILLGMFTISIYLMFSFYTLSFNITDWSKEVRVFAIICWGIYFSLSLTYIEEK